MRIAGDDGDAGKAGRRLRPRWCAGPPVGRSKRSSWPLFGAFTSTPRPVGADAPLSSRSRATRASSASVPSMSSTADHLPVVPAYGLADVERPKRRQHLPGLCAMSVWPVSIGVARAMHFLRHQKDRGATSLMPTIRKPSCSRMRPIAGHQMIVAAAKGPDHIAEERAAFLPSSRISDSAGRSGVPMKIRSRRPFAGGTVCIGAAELPDRDPVMAEASRPAPDHRRRAAQAAPA